MEKNDVTDEMIEALLDSLPIEVWEAGASVFIEEDPGPYLTHDHVRSVVEKTLLAIYKVSDEPHARVSSAHLLC